MSVQRAHSCWTSSTPRRWRQRRPAGFDISQVRAGVAGLGLVRALLPSVMSGGQFGLAALSKARETVSAFRLYFKAVP